MILVDANAAPLRGGLFESHHPAKDWWDEQLSGSDPVSLVDIGVYAKEFSEIH